MSSGIVRRIDDLGRIIIPREIRMSMGIVEGDPLEIGVNEDKTEITLTPYHSKVSDKINRLAISILNCFCSEECEEIVDDLKVIAKKIEKIEKNA